MFCPCVEALITFVASERGYDDGDVEVNIGLDAGGGFCKVCMTVHQPNSHQELELRGEFGAPLAKKRKLSKYKDTGVKAAFVIGIVEQIPENYQNFKTL